MIAQVSLRTVARVFLRLGVIGFGGPAAHIALMHDDIVRKRGWISDAEFNDLLAATNLIPGPNSTEMAIHIGRRVAGWRGLLVAGICFIVPAALMVGALAAVYVRYGRTPNAEAMLRGIAPVVIAVIAHAMWQLSRSALRTAGLWLLTLAAAAAALAGVNELVVLLIAGLGVVAWRAVRRSASSRVCAVAPVAAVQLALFFLKVGSVLFGSGYVLAAFLRRDLVERWGWLTDRQLLDAIAVGQVTPGPVFTTATFVGYLLGGWWGAAISTIAIFLPAFVFVALTQPLIPRLRRSGASAFLDGVVAASLGLIAAVVVTLAEVVFTHPSLVVTAVLALGLLAGTRVNPAWLIAAGAAAGVASGR
jgi:chromate transporter